ncbi:hypothetical protein DFH27DRAFT_616686 [Peziza echinospora]|nr:hypothetical protein DFH27DRAFT_616686 [Peziza echinospora]
MLPDASGNVKGLSPTPQAQRVALQPYPTPRLPQLRHLDPPLHMRSRLRRANANAPPIIMRASDVDVAEWEDCYGVLSFARIESSDALPYEYNLRTDLSKRAWPPAVQRPAPGVSLDAKRAELKEHVLSLVDCMPLVGRTLGEAAVYTRVGNATAVCAGLPVRSARVQPEDPRCAGITCVYRYTFMIDDKRMGDDGQDMAANGGTHADATPTLDANANAPWMRCSVCCSEVYFSPPVRCKRCCEFALSAHRTTINSAQ